MTGAVTRPGELSRATLLEAAGMLLPAKSVWIATHRDPDGDAIGSLLGLGRLLSALGADVTLACADPAPIETTFLPGTDSITATPPTAPDVAVAVDAGDFGRLGGLVDWEAWSALPTVVIDHHASNAGYGDVNVVEPLVSSTSELVLELALAAGVTIDTDTALCLLTGVVSDTLGFRTTNTSEATLRRAATLMRLGAPLPEVAERLFSSRPLASMRLIGRALATLEVKGGSGVAVLTAEDFDTASALPEHARGLSSFLATTRELRAVALLRERRNGTVDVSMRSRAGTDLGPVAARLGGGGHPQAAGARIEGTDLAGAIAAVWAALLGELGES